MPDGSYKVLLTNPCSLGGGCGDPVPRDSISEAYIIVPEDDGAYLLYLAGTFIGESDSLAGIDEIINEDGARSESVLVENPSGGYKVYSYKRKNPKKKSSKRKTAKRKSTKKGQRRKTARRAYEPKKKATKKKATKRKATKKKATKRKVTKRKTTKRKATRRNPHAKVNPRKKKATKRSTRKGGTRKTARKAYVKETPSQAKSRINAALKALMSKKR